MKALMLLFCLSLSTFTYGHTYDYYWESKLNLVPTPMVVPIEGRLPSREVVEADIRVTRLERITSELEKRVKSLESKVDELEKLEKRK